MMPKTNIRTLLENYKNLDNIQTIGQFLVGKNPDSKHYDFVFDLQARHLFSQREIINWENSKSKY